MIISIITFLLVLSVLVLVHEAGHFFAAKKAGILVEEFGFGLPPRIFGKKFGETLYSINLLPFGGFVRLHGENTEDTITNPDRAFMNKSKRVRVAVILAGVIMNFILGILAFSVVYSFMGIPRKTDYVKVVEVRNNSPAQKAGLVQGDIIRSVNNKLVKSNSEFISLIESDKGKEISLGVQKAGESSTTTINTTPRENPPEGEGALGVVITSSEIFFPPIWQRPFWGAYYGVVDAVFWGKLVTTGMFSMVAGLFKGQVPQDVAGPVGIYALTTQAASYGLLTLINFLGVLSVNLAILNVIPFPALDGGRLLFILIEGVFGKRVVPKVEAAIHTVGIIILITLILAITAHDVQKLVASGGVAGYLDSVLK
jgi:regulator of sigma E protease